MDLTIATTTRPGRVTLGGTSTIAVDRLSERQRKILELVARGLTNDEIGSILAISPKTVRTHVTAILDRLDLSNRTEAAVFYTQWAAATERVDVILQRPAIAVLPLIALDDDPAARTVARAVAHDLAALFARWCWFPVIAHSSTIGAHQPGEAIPAIGARLGARYLVDGVLQTSPRAWRISVSIHDVESGCSLWSDRRELAPGELFRVQDQVTTAIVAEAYPMLIAHAEASLPRVSEPREVDAWQLAHEGMRLHGARALASHAGAVVRFDAAIEREPELVLAHYGRGLAYYDAILNQWGSIDRAREGLLECAERCVRLAPHAAEGYHLHARYWQACGQHPRAVTVLEAAIARNPSFAAAHALLAQVHEIVGRSDQADTRMRQASRLGPGSFVGGLATLHFARGDHREALVAAEQAIDRAPRYPYARVVAAASAWWSGEHARARAHAGALWSDAPGFSPATFRETFGADVESVIKIAEALTRIGAAR